MKRIQLVATVSILIVSALGISPASAQRTFTARSVAECDSTARQAADIIHYYRQLRAQQARQNPHRPGIEQLSTYELEMLRRQREDQQSQLARSCRLFGPTRQRPWVHTFVENR